MRRLALALGMAMLGLGPSPPARAASIEVTVDANGGVPISPLLYGVNYVWTQVPEAEFPAYQAAMTQVVHASLARYLGGWGAESYDWAHNVETGRKATGMAAGVPPDAFLAAVPAASFITPSARAIADPGLIGPTASESAALVARYGGRVSAWEIGNEWWLQGGAKNHQAKRDRNLAAYAALLAAAAPAMKAANPQARIFATLDWTHPEDAGTLRAMAGAAWTSIDGISVHPYCGTADPERLCGSLPAALARLRAASGKTLIYASEWAATQRMNPTDDGIANADLTVEVLQDLALGGVDMAAYWPPVKMVPGLALVSNDYRTASATGLAFGWMAQSYQGLALGTSGGVAAVAARRAGQVSVIVPSWGATGIVRVRFIGFTPRLVVSGEVLHETPDGPLVSPLAVTLGQESGQESGQEGGQGYAQFSINPGTPGRGSGYEIARVVLQ